MFQHYTRLVLVTACISLAAWGIARLTLRGPVCSYDGIGSCITDRCENCIPDGCTCRNHRYHYKW